MSLAQPSLRLGDDVISLEGLTAIKIIPQPSKNVDLVSMLREPTIVVFVRNFA
jgi:hypothetical protein